MNSWFLSEKSLLFKDMPRLFMCKLLPFHGVQGKVEMDAYLAPILNTSRLFHAGGLSLYCCYHGQVDSTTESRKYMIMFYWRAIIYTWINEACLWKAMIFLKGIMNSLACLCLELAQGTRPSRPFPELHV
jgi:hypothetical protein